MKLTVSALIIFITSGCVSNYKLFQKKDSCYEEKIRQYEGLPQYGQVMKIARDTLDSRVRRNNYYSNYWLDKSVFFNKDTSKCLIIISYLRSEKEGVADLWTGTKKGESWEISDGRPRFGITFSDLSLQFFNNPTSETVARLMRFEILKSGDVRLKGCEFDDKYWFEYFYNPNKSRKGYKQRIRFRI